MNDVNKHKQQLVTIKGTKEGLTLHLDDTCSFQSLLQELEEKLSLTFQGDEEGPFIAVHLQIGNRFLTNEQEEQIRVLIRSKKQLVVDSIEGNVISKEEALTWKRETEVVPVCKIIRSGQVLHVQGDLLLIGDVNPGGKVVAGGNIFVLGALRGVAHAGANNDKQSVIAASVMKPSQLKICNIISRAPEYDDDSSHGMECAYINDDNKIIVDRLQLLTHIRPILTRLERGM
ncbi:MULTISPECIES: septum site-determining protein MinC [Bacillaceae]|uniref:septum site-determining protein MinC n=1 Tax=Bacillaceae TaxID=186817 RepID=UPI002A135512|nr:septum site-determining protein MinC [Cytobacillus sp. IB215316]MDX8359419.1 septum site-determining protein MinC [Cytobacillus sp. IB215316]